MVKVMGKDEMLELADRVMDAYRKGSQYNPGLMQHLSDSYDIAFEVAGKVYDNNIYLRKSMDSREVALAGGLHDIGRPLQDDQLFHELRGADYIEKNGVHENIANFYDDAYRIAQMIRPHGFVWEQFNDEANTAARKEFEYLNPTLLLPRTIPEMIVTYADLTNLDGKRISMEERLDELKDRSRKDPGRLRAMKKARLRLMDLNMTIDNVTSSQP
jgi:hypothetical protein